MLYRFATSALLTLCLALTSLAAVVAETRMAAAGNFCGTGAPQILLDQAGMPVLNGDGAPIEAPECDICHLAFALATPSAGPTQTISRMPAPTHVAAPAPPPLSVRLDRHARAPPCPAGT